MTARPPSLDDQIADMRQVLQQRRRVRAGLKPHLRPKATEVADRRIRLAEATLATLEQARDAAEASGPRPPPQDWIVTAPNPERRGDGPPRTILSRHPTRTEAEDAARRLGAAGLQVAYDTRAA